MDFEDTSIPLQRPRPLTSRQGPESPPQPPVPGPPALSASDDSSAGRLGAAAGALDFLPGQTRPGTQSPSPRPGSGRWLTCRPAQTEQRRERGRDREGGDEEGHPRDPLFSSPHQQPEHREEWAPRSGDYQKERPPNLSGVKALSSLVLVFRSQRPS